MRLRWSVAVVALLLGVLPSVGHAQAAESSSGLIENDVDELFGGATLADLGARRGAQGFPIDADSTSFAMRSETGAISFSEVGGPLAPHEWVVVLEHERLQMIRDRVVTLLQDQGIEPAYTSIGEFEDVGGDIRITLGDEIVVGVNGDLDVAQGIISVAFPSEPIRVQWSDLTREDYATGVSRVAEAISSEDAAGLLPADLQVLRIGGHVGNSTLNRTTIAVDLVAAGRDLISERRWMQLEDAIRVLEDYLSSLVGLEVVVERAITIPQEDCSRTSFWPTLRAGLTIRRGTSAGATCTMGFHVRQHGTSRFLSAAHCSHGPAKSNNWLHAGSNVGTRVSESAYVSGTHQSNPGVDAMLVSIPGGAPSHRFFQDNQRPGQRVSRFRSSAFGSNDEFSQACQSGAVSHFQCGYLFDLFMPNIVQSGDGFFVWNVRVNYVRTGGDSGAPVVRKGFNSDCGNCRAAWGLHRGSEGFTPINEIMSRYILALEP
jgi:hypothetical protein